MEDTVVGSIMVRNGNCVLKESHRLQILAQARGSNWRNFKIDGI